MAGCENAAPDPGPGGSWGDQASSRGSLRGIQACRAGEWGHCRQKRPSDDLVQLVLFSVSSSLPPTPSRN